MKKVIMVHGWEGGPSHDWFPDTKKELKTRGYEVVVPEMPETNLPKLNKWLPKLRETIGKPSKNLYLIGHSAGCVTILRYLESLEGNKKIGGAVFVAGFTDDLGYKELKNFFETPIDFEKIKTHCPKFIAIHSDNDPDVSLKHGDIFKEKLNAKLIVKHNMGHFSQDDGCTRLPDVSESLLEISK